MPIADDTPPIVAAVRRFVEKEVRPVASTLEHGDRYPHSLVARLQALGLFGALIPKAYGGLGLDCTTYARVIEELCRGWMSLAGVINSHTMAALIVLNHGTEEQRRQFLPRLASGAARGGLCLTEAHAGSDVQAIRTVARRQGDHYRLTGTKMFVTNGREGNTFALLALTDPAAQPPHRGMSCFIVEKGHPGFQVVKSIAKLGYKGVDTAELVFEECPVPAANLVGDLEGRGFKQVMSGLETGRINIAARAVGVAQAALDDAVRHVRAQRTTPPPPALADMATKLSAARLLTYWAAGMKDRGERCDLEAGMAKLYASEAAQEIAAESMRLHGEAGTLASLEVERHYRDTPLMLIGEGTNEIQRLLIARHLLERDGEQPGGLTPLEGMPDDPRLMVLAVRQFVEKQVLPLVGDAERAGRYPADLVEKLGDLGILGAGIPTEHGGLGLDLATCAMIVEELARGWTTLAAIVSGHLAVACLVARNGSREQKSRLLSRMAQGAVLGSIALSGNVRARRARRGWVLSGHMGAVDNATRAGLFAVLARTGRGRSACFLVERDSGGWIVTPPVATLGAHGLDTCQVRLTGVRSPGGGLVPAAALAAARLGLAATAVGVAQAAFEAALRYSQQRSAFGKPICQHQAIQLKLADMATQITAARLLTGHAASRMDIGAADGAVEARMAKLHASQLAATVTLEAMRIHGGYGYTAEFPVERFYRDAPHLVLALGGNEAERLAIARRLRGRA